eukprot:gene30878-35923_t
MRASQSMVASRASNKVLVARFSRTPLVCKAQSKAKFFVGGNWKCNGTVSSVKELVAGLNAGAGAIKDVDVVVAPTYIHLDMVQQSLDSKILVSAQNMWIEGPGAYTGEISAEQINDLGLKWVITGHSERRALFGESNEVIAQKTVKALAHGLSVIACIGETLAQREAGQMFPVIDAQIQALVDVVKDWDRVVIAYEPVWAIGTGVVATPVQAQEAHAHLREVLEAKLGVETARKLRLLYGGSVNDQNCKELAAQEDIDGFLVGGASLNADSFLHIIESHTAKLSAV